MEENNHGVIKNICKGPRAKFTLNKDALEKLSLKLGTGNSVLFH